MVDVSGIPNMGFGGGSYFGGNAATGQPAFSAADINNSMGWNPYASFDPWANTPGGFGAQTAYYQQAAANNYGNINAATLYGSDGGWSGARTWDGRPDTGGGEDWSSYFNSITGGPQQANPYTGPSAGYDPYDPSTYNPGTSWQPPAQPDPWASLGYNPGAAFGGGFQSAPGSMFDPSFYAPSGGGNGGWSGATKWDGSPDYGGSGGIGSDARYGGIDPGNINRYREGMAYGQPSANPSYFDPNTFAGAGAGGYDPWRAAALPAYDPNSFANRFAAGGYGSDYGTPSQYYTGSQYPGGQMPPGFSGDYGVDNPGGALPLNLWGSGGSYQPGG